MRKLTYEIFDRQGNKVNEVSSYKELEQEKAKGMRPIPRMPPHTCQSLNKAAFAVRRERGRVKADAKIKHQRLTVRAEYFWVAGLPKILYSA